VWLLLVVISVILSLSSWHTCLCKCGPLKAPISITFHHIPFIPAMPSLVVHSSIHLILVFPYVVTPSAYSVCPWLCLFVYKLSCIFPSLHLINWLIFPLSLPRVQFPCPHCNFGSSMDLDIFGRTSLKFRMMIVRGHSTYLKPSPSVSRLLHDSEATSLLVTPLTHLKSVCVIFLMLFSSFLTMLILSFCSLCNITGLIYNVCLYHC
jgi:hypothetical protein